MTITQCCLMFVIGNSPIINKQNVQPQREISEENLNLATLQQLDDVVGFRVYPHKYVNGEEFFVIYTTVVGWKRVCLPFGDTIGSGGR